MAKQPNQAAVPNRKSRMFDTPESAGLWFDVFNGILLFGAFLVFVGTWGTIKTAGIKERFSDDRVMANEAETRRAVADSDAAREGSAKANERVAELSTQAEQLRRGTAEANARAAEAQLALERLKSPRRLSLPQSRAVIDKLSSMKDIAGSTVRPTIAVFSLRNDFESSAFADQLAEVFKMAGFPINRYPVMYGKTYMVLGVGILASKDSSGIALAETVADALRSNGISTFVVPDRRVGGESPNAAYNASISVMVGDKPP
jgi:hypothetical protein